ncbi:MAG: DNA gyrase subunit A [Chloroflexi bacterium]|nr:DNA gyrase subunit A [Chloroflexota bacterium]MBV9897194.1 DNA gyrase subunit A [Chloroflexota bacterium]
MATEDIGNIRQILVEDEMRSSYLDYAMSVITARALPDARDGLKPAQRRILVAMNDLNLAPNRGYRKCAKIAGDTSGNYHPHGEAVVYPTLVRLAQPFNMRYPLVDGQGNFGSVDGDPPAAMRYTEARLTPLAMEMLADIDMNTVDMFPNYDGTRDEPVPLPGRFPNLICNGSAGIAVGMATNIPPHNLSEVVDALHHLIEHPDVTIDELMQFIKGPDFPTGGQLIINEKNREGLVINNLKHAYATGRGRVLIRAKVEFEESSNGRTEIVVTELPYQVNKALLQERIAELVREKKIDGIAAMNDYSDRRGMRLVIETKRDANPHTVLNHLYKHTAMQQAFGFNMLALVDGQPQLMPLKRLLVEFLDHRQEVLTRRTQFELDKARQRAHVLEGLVIALDHLDAVIQTIRSAESREAARPQLMTNFGLSEVQARAILEMQLGQLANLERQRILEEYEEIKKRVAYLEDLLANPRKITYLVRDELADLKKKFGDARRTEIVSDFAGEITDEDLVANEKVLVTVSGRGYVKRMPANTYRVQRRGGRGIIGQVLREEDALRHMIAANARDNILFFSDNGKVYQLKAWQVPSYDRTARGTPLINVINLEAGESITAILAAPDFENSDFLIFATRSGEVKKSPLKDFSQVRSNGLRAMSLEEDDELLSVKHCRTGDHIILVTERGQSARFTVDVLRTASRVSGGVRGIKLAQGDQLAAMDVVDPDAQLLIVTQGGYGKRTPLSSYPVKGRGIGGVRAIRTTPKTGTVAAARVVQGHEELMMISAQGIVIRTPLETISERTGRATSGVILMNLRDGDRMAAIAILEPSSNGDGDGGNGEPTSSEDVSEDADSDVLDEEALAALPSQADIDASEAEASAEDDDDSDADEQADEEEVVDTDDDAQA